MALHDVFVQIELVASQESVVSGMRKSAARALQEYRESIGVSLRDVAAKAGLTYQGLSNLEHGKSWRTRTALRVAEVYRTLETSL